MAMGRNARGLFASVALAFSTAWFGIGSASAQTAPSAASAGPKVVLVELFTSEGCSSCPPADALLRRIDQTRTAAGQLVVGISEHVTYWDSLGWSDPFSLEAATQRQNAYGLRFGLESVYTPQMVVNGADQFVGSDSERLRKALRQADGQTSPIALRILSINEPGSELASASDNAVTAKLSVGGEFPAHSLDLIAVVADDADSSNVQRGENSGRTLTHVAVARSIARVAKLQAGGDLTVRVALPASLRPSQPRHLILFAQVPGNGRVLVADSKAF